MKRIHVGARVRVVGTEALLAALRGPAAGRPEPGQMLWAGRRASVVGFRRGRRDGRSLFTLKDAPGLWPQEWLDLI